MKQRFLYWISILAGLSLALAACSAEPQAPQTGPQATQVVTQAVEPPSGQPASTQAADTQAVTNPTQPAEPAQAAQPEASPTPAVPKSPEKTVSPVTEQPPLDKPVVTREAVTDEQLFEQLESTQWHLASYLDLSGNQLSVPVGAPVTLSFTQDQVNGASFCNSYFGKYRIENHRLLIGQLGSTLMACEQPRMDLEKMYLQRLSESAGFDLIDNQLTINNDAGQTILVFTGGPGSAASAASTAPVPLADANIPTGLKPDALRQTEYRSGFTVSGRAPMKAGVYQEAGAPGSSSQTIVRLTDSIAYGKLADGKVAAAVILTTETGGSGAFYELHLLGSLDNGQPLDMGSIFLGDRVKINSLQFQGEQMLVDMIAQGPTDPMCCPTQHQVVTITYQDGQLSKQVQADTVSATVAVTGTLAAPGVTPLAPGAAAQATVPPVTSLNGVIWQWAEIEDNNGQRLLVNQPYRYTLEFAADGTLRVQADCNSGTGKYTQNGNQLKLEGFGMTKMACPPASLYDTFMANLGNVAFYTLNNNALYLTLKDKGGIMKLNPAP